MADVYSAGTYIAAVMQTAGFASQAELLNQLGVLIQRFGVLLYVLAAISAFLAINLAGNYRIALHLLLGPIIFSFLIGSRSAVDGAVWKIGAGPPRTLNGVAASEDEALKAVNQSTTDENLKNLTRGNIPVAFPFRLFTSVADSVIKSITNVVLPLSDKTRENVKNVLFVSKTYALDTLLKLRLENDTALEIFNRDLFGQCHQMMDAGISLASPDLNGAKERRTEDLIKTVPSQNAKDVQRQTLASLRQTRAEKLATWTNGRDQKITPSAVTVQYMKATQGVATPESAALRWLRANAPGKNIEDISQLSMTCGEVWDIAADSILRSAREQTSTILKEFGQQLSTNEQGAFCVELARKMGMALADGDEAECRNYALVQLAAVQMIRNAVRMTGYSKAIQAKKDQMIFTASKAPLRSVPLDTMDVDDLELADGLYNTLPREEKDPVTGAPRTMGRFKSKRTGEVESFDRPYLTMNFDVAGEFESGFVYNQQFTTRELRQSIFTAAINIPYYQGLLFYLLSIAYPFICLVTILPGRAGAILNYFLAWLWVRSWDLGFALVMILDKVLWNLFPSTDFSKDYWGGKQIGQVEVPVVLQKAFAEDPAYNTHAYYFILQMALFAVPTICGYLTLKLRRNVVEGISQTFTGSVFQAAKERADIAGSQVQMLQITNQTQYMKELYGAALRTTGASGEGVMGGDKLQSASYWADLRASGARLEAQTLLPSNMLPENQQKVAAGMYQIAYKKTMGEMLNVEGTAAAYERRLMHPVFGQTGENTIMANAMAASFDGGGTYELFKYEEPLKEYISALNDLMVTKDLLRADVNSIHLLAQSNVQRALAFEGAPTNQGSEAFSREFRESAVEGLLQWYDQIATGRNRMREEYEAIEKDETARARAREDFEHYIASLSKNFTPEQVERILSLPSDRSQWEFGLKEAVYPSRPIGEFYWREGLK